MSWFERYSLRLRMILFFVGAVAVMIAHHCFYRFLDAKPVGFEDGVSRITSFILAYYTSIANLMAIVAKGFIVAILGIVFAQIFWMQTRRKHYSVQQISNSLACKDSPIGSLKTVQSTSLFSAITFLGLSLIVITIFAPGAVKIRDGTISGPCDVSTVDMSDAGIAVFDGTGESGLNYRNPIAQVKSFVGRVLLSGEPLPPLVKFDKFGGSTNYSLTFNAPSLVCTDITGSFNFEDALPDPDTANDNIVIWNATRTITNGSLVFTVATGELVPSGDDNVMPGGSPEAVSCVPYESTYVVQVVTGFDDGSRPFVDVQSVVPNVPLSPASAASNDSAEVQHYAIVDSLTNLLNGTASYVPSSFDFTDESPIVAYSPMGAALADSPWFWVEPMLTALPLLMQNVSVSILSDILSETNFPTLKSTSTTCDDDNVFYVYQPLRLFLPYGIGLLIGALGIFVGFYAISVNGREESLEFGRIFQFVTRGDTTPGAEKQELGSVPYLPSMS